MLSSMLSLLVHAAIPLEGASSSQPLCAVGDLHGDPDHALRALRLCGAVDASGRWAGGTMTVVCGADEQAKGEWGELNTVSYFDCINRRRT